MIIITPIESPY